MVNATSVSKNSQNFKTNQHHEYKSILVSNIMQHTSLVGMILIQFTSLKRLSIVSQDHVPEGDL